MKRNTALLIAAAFLASFTASEARSHCQIPCGIYDDPARFVLMAEHIATIEKSMKTIVELSAQEKPDYNQLGRWVANRTIRRRAERDRHLLLHGAAGQAA
jgi:nickel superoxide dismutase